ncbi:DUF4129 domain-containing protein [Kitasatospora kifunensis]
MAAMSTARLRQVLAAVAVAGLGFAALELRPNASLLNGSLSAPLTGEFGLMLVLCFCWMILIERTYRHYRGQVQHLPYLPPRADRLKTAALRLLPLAGLLLPLALVALYRVGNVLHPLPSVSIRQSRSVESVSSEPTGTSSDLVGLMALLFQITLGLAMLVLLVLAWRRLRKPAKTGKTSTPRRVRTTEQELAEAVSSARRALLHGNDARAAVIACYLAMEESLAASGVERLIADSPTDLLERAVAAGTLRDAEASTLTTLFREARFSQHPMGQTHLDQAKAALDAIAEQLADRIAERARAAAEAAEARARATSGSQAPSQPPTSSSSSSSSQAPSTGANS